jgi:alpha-L-fucosidase 2
LEWKNGEISKVIIKSNLGGNCRIRSYNKLKSVNKTNIKFAEGENQNPFYQIPSIKEPIISDKANLNKLSVRKTYLYDIETESGKTYIISE